MAKVATRKGGHMSVEEVNAYASAYGSPLSKRDYLFMCGIPACFGLALYYLLYNPFLAIIGTALGLYYGRFYIVPQTVQRKYAEAALANRSNLLKALTQGATNERMIPAQMIHRALSRIEGEIKEEFEIVETNLALGRLDLIPALFNQIREKYREDIVFCQYMEQLETRFMKGIPNIKALKDMDKAHNDMMQISNKFKKDKDGHINNLKVLVGIHFVFLSIIEFAFGWNTYYNAYAQSIVGNIGGLIYIGTMFFFIHQNFKLYFDDSVTEVQVKKLADIHAKKDKIDRIVITNDMRALSELKNDDGAPKGFGISNEERRKRTMGAKKGNGGK
jgi:hypothetical protein